MSQVIPICSHNGWSPEETALLWQEVRSCAAVGQPLRVAFDKLAERTGRKSNSIRNYYYAAVKSGDAPQDVPTGRAAPFTPFTDEEIDDLLRHVLSAQGQGISVRACVLSLANGDRSLALRLQNKYRALLKAHPERVRNAMQQLQSEQKPCIDPYRRLRSLPRDAQLHTASADRIVHQLLLLAERMDSKTSAQYLSLCSQIADLISLS